jgi:hypothetical protein
VDALPVRVECCCDVLEVDVIATTDTAVARSEARDHLLDARKNCMEVRNNLLPGLPLYEAMRRVIAELDAALTGLKP